MSEHRPNVWRSFLGWFILLVAGFIYVAVVLCQRFNPFQSGNPGFGDFIVLSLVSPLLFFLGPKYNWLPEEVSAWSVFKWNGLSYVVPFFLMLHWEFVGETLGTQFSLTPQQLTSLDSASSIVLILAVLLIFGLLAIHLVFAWRLKFLTGYVAMICLVPFAVLIITWFLGRTHYIHVHHYSLGLFLFPFFRFRNTISLIAQTAFLGLAVEGIARWGMDPLWCVST